MLISEIAHVWSRSGGKTNRKFRCTSGPRKGRVMASPASCNKPLDLAKSKNLKQLKKSKGQAIQNKASLTRRTNPASQRLKTINKPRPRKAAGRRI